jgi:hypothetical protein
MVSISIKYDKDLSPSWEIPQELVKNNKKKEVGLPPIDLPIAIKEIEKVPLKPQ